MRPFSRLSGQVGAWGRWRLVVPTVAVAAVFALLAAALVTGANLGRTPPSHAAIPAEAAAASPHSGQTPPPAAAASAETAPADTAPSGNSPNRGGSEVVERPKPARTYPLDYKPVALGPAGVGGLTNPKSKPISSTGPRADAKGQVAFPTSPAGRGLPYVETGTGAGVSPGEVGALIEEYFPQPQWERANAVSQCESHQRNEVSRPNRDGSVDRGVFQLNDGGTLQRLLTEFGYPASDVTQALDVRWNVQAAALLYSQRGWEPWTCATELGIWP